MYFLWLVFSLLANFPTGGSPQSWWCKGWTSHGSIIYYAWATVEEAALKRRVNRARIITRAWKARSSTVV